MLKPRSLCSGARIAIVSPASTPAPDRVHAGVLRLAALGYEPVIFPSALAAGPLYYAGTAESRAADLHAAFLDPSIEAVVCTRGGWGSAELLPLLDAELILANPKPFIGFSDQTTLHLWLSRQCGLVTFYAPMLSPDFARGDRLEDGVDLSSWNAALTGVTDWSLGSAAGMRVLKRGTGMVRGRIFGGCVTLLVESLGTSWALKAPQQESILFLEEVDTRAYQWDRMMLHLQFAGVFDRVTGIVFGDMTQCLTSETEEGRRREAELIEAAILHRLRDFAGPVAIGLQCGHVDTPNHTLPLGVAAELDCSGEPSLRLLEAATAP